VRVRAGVLLAVLAVVACDSVATKPANGVASCEITLWYKPESPLSRVEVVTSWEAWQTGLHVLDDAPDGWRATRVTPPPGEQQYAFVDDGVWVADPFVGTTAFHNGAEVTLLFEQDCSMPSLQIDSTSALSFVSAHDGVLLDPASIHVSSDVAATVTADPTTGTIALTWGTIAPGKHVAMVTASDTRGRTTSPARLTLWSQPWDWHDALIYQVIVDRYRNRSGALAAPNPPSGWAGGTLAGLTANLDAIAALGFNALWVSPLYQNPQGTFLGNDGREYGGYHGYWPIASRAIDSRFGTEQDVTDFVSAAHARNMRVIFDVVPHHVHQEHPYVAAHPGSPWFTDWQENCVCGVGSCDWGAHIQDCWFASYLPSFDWHDLDVADTVTSDVAWWLDHFNADGLRIDAVPMMPRAANRRIVDAVRRAFDHPGQRMYIVGENFVGAGATDLLRYELGPFGLDGEFDFPMMWALRDAIAEELGPMSEIDDAEKAGEASWAGSGAVMSRIIGNHDVPRFSSVSAGDAAGDGFVAAPQSTDPVVYGKQRIALVIAYTLPGAAVVYYGDEVGLAGRNDPDSRRVFPSDVQLSPDQLATRMFAQALGKTRACSDALRRGTYRSLVADAEAIAYAREDASVNDAAIVAVSRNGQAPITFPMQGMTKGTWVDALGSGLSFDAASPTVTLPTHAAAIFVPKGSPCSQ
jgi:glycosidase